MWKKIQCSDLCEYNTMISLKKKKEAYTHISLEGNRETKNICFLPGGELNNWQIKRKGCNSLYNLL